MPGITLPPFPDNVPTYPLLAVDFALIKSGTSKKSTSSGRLPQNWDFGKHEVDEMFKMGEEFFDLPLDKKLEFDQGDGGDSYGYKAAGSTATDEYGSVDKVEYINVAKDDALAYPSVVHRTYPPTVVARMDSTILPFVHKSIEVNNTVLSIFEKKLGLPAGALLECHADGNPGGSEARVTKNLDPSRVQDAKGKVDVTLGAHTDYGSLTFLHNRLGGLQVLPPGSDEWQYVRPLPGHAVSNIGDTLTLFSGGILRSSLHRVVVPPGAQALSTRWSLVFHTRPGYNVPLRMLKDASETIKDLAEKMTPEQRQKFEPNVTTKEWLVRRNRNRRIKNRKGPETWREALGMEYRPV
ncbi:Clavaminate synthase-like protein [Phellopilus nigrolimitatus]|nr:Clavaminate synthase-like protein [Phellopilus nigrolimitatus]